MANELSNENNYPLLHTENDDEMRDLQGNLDPGGIHFRDLPYLLWLSAMLSNEYHARQSFRFSDLLLLWFDAGPDPATHCGH